MFYQFHLQMKKMLGQLLTWLDLAETHAKSKPFDPNLYLELRLAPDQFALVRQVQSSCDTAKFVAARLTGKQPPSHPDSEKTLDELRQRVRTVMTYLDSFSASDYAGASERVISTPRWEGKVMSGADYFMEHGVPNFFFHITHTYAILRHNGVNLGKRDYLGAQTRRAP